MKEMKIRLIDDAKVEDIDIWLASGTVRISRTALLNYLLEAFHSAIDLKGECTLEAVAEGISTAVKIGKVTVDKKRFNAG